LTYEREQNQGQRHEGEKVILKVGQGERPQGRLKENPIRKTLLGNDHSPPLGEEVKQRRGKRQTESWVFGKSARGKRGNVECLEIIYGKRKKRLPWGNVCARSL